MFGAVALNNDDVRAGLSGQSNSDAPVSASRNKDARSQRLDLRRQAIEQLLGDTDISQWIDGMMNDHGVVRMPVLREMGVMQPGGDIHSALRSQAIERAFNSPWPEPTNWGDTSQKSFGAGGGRPSNGQIYPGK